MATAQQAYLGQCQITDALKNFSCDANAVTLTTGKYYCAGYDSGSTDIQLVEHIEDAMVAAGEAGATCSLSLTTGKVTLSFSGTTTVTWTDSDLGVALGFGSAALSGASSYTGTYPMRWFWSPSVPPSRLPVDLDEFWEAHSGTVCLQAPGSTSYSRVGELAYYAQLAYENLESAEVLRTAGGDETDNGTFEQMFFKVFHAGMPVRIVKDRSSYAATTDYETGLFADPSREGEIGGFRGWASPTLGEDFHGLWDVDLFLCEHV